MKKLHKINRVDWSICTAEQKIAYNYAQSYADIYAKIIRATPDSIKKEVYYGELFDAVFDELMESNCKYYIQAIMEALYNGIRVYYQQNAPILTSYEAIGKAFPLDIAKFTRKRG